MFVYVWEYVVVDEQRLHFVESYGPNGPWVELFRRGDGYISTELLADADHRGRFVTVDRWISKDARDAFRAVFSEEFESLDRECASLTLDERFVGDFDVMPRGV